MKDREARGEEMEWWWVDVAAMVAIKQCIRYWFLYRWWCIGIVLMVDDIFQLKRLSKCCHLLLMEQYNRSRMK